MRSRPAPAAPLMSPFRPSSPRPPWLAFAFAAIAYAGALAWMLPEGVTPVGGDEFGYVKSVVETLQHGRPWTDNYLEPWAATLSSLAAIIFKATGSMTVAMHGLMLVGGAAAMLALCLLLHRRWDSTTAAIVGAALIFSFPPLLRRNAEFIDLAVSLPAMLWCLWAAERRRWVVFALVWAAAIANRQSAVLWLLLPATAAVRGWLGERRGEPAVWRIPAAVVAAGVAWFFAVARAMNISDIQFDRTLRTIADLSPRPLATAMFSCGVIALLALGGGALAQRFVRGASFSPGTWSRARWIVVGAVAAACLFLDPRHLVMVDHRYGFLYGPSGWAYGKLALLLAAAGWLSGRFRLRLDLALCLLATLGAIALRQLLFDRYAFEISLLAFLAVLPADEATQPAIADAATAPRLRPVIAGALAVLAGAQLWFALLTKVAIDDAAASVRLHEQALRAGLIQPWEIGGAPFQLRGWYFHAYSVQHPLPNGRKLAEFARFTQPTVVAWNEFPSWIARLHGLERVPRPEHGETLVEQRYSVAGFATAQRGLTRVAPPTRPEALKADFRAVPLPLDDAEWRALVAGEPLR